MNKPVIALGYFDSIHLGHKKLIDEALKYARERGQNLSVCTFEDGFLSSIGRNEKEVFLLRERRTVLKDMGVEDIIVFPCNSDFLSQSKENFCQSINVINPSAVFVGADYRFGKNASGDVNCLKALINAPVFIVDILFINEKKVSTSSVRDLITEGRIKEANTFLSTPYFISGTVTQGRKVGREMGLPTVNLIPSDNKLLPKFGVYAAEARVEGKGYAAVVNIGDHPTFNDVKCNVEAHIIDYSGDLYGKEITVKPIEYLREIKKFDDALSLKNQIESDIKTTKEITDDKIRSCGKQ